MVPLALVRTAVEEQEQHLRRDPWAYGLTPANRKNLETIQRYTHQQGMIADDARRSTSCSTTPTSATAAGSGGGSDSRSWPGSHDLSRRTRLADIPSPRMRESEARSPDRRVHDGAHFIEKPNPVMVLTGFKSLGPAAAVLRRDGGAR